MPEDIDRRKLIEEKIRKAEAKAVTTLSVIRQVIRDFLVVEKGWSEEDLELDKEFVITLDNEKMKISVDFILKINGRRIIVIKCSPGALESRERHIVSFARVVDSHQIPFAVVTDGSQARILDAISGKPIAEGLNSIPGKSRIVDTFQAIEFIPYPEERRERETRILLAFDAIKCTEEACE